MHKSIKLQHLFQFCNLTMGHGNGWHASAYSTSLKRSSVRKKRLVLLFIIIITII
uniref:Uncharacterized protein n=1 Tax=Anguilla anguilla TaxID=7936 RepID=A0A0E9XCG5_ANGAN